MIFIYQIIETRIKRRKAARHAEREIERLNIERIVEHSRRDDGVLHFAEMLQIQEIRQSFGKYRTAQVAAVLPVSVGTALAGERIAGVQALAAEIREKAAAQFIRSRFGQNIDARRAEPVALRAERVLADANFTNRLFRRQLPAAGKAVNINLRSLRSGC